MKYSELIKHIENMSDNNRDLLLEALIDVHSSNPTKDMDITNVYGQDKIKFTDYARDKKCDVKILRALINYHKDKFGNSVALSGKKIVDVVCEYGGVYSISQLCALAKGVPMDKIKDIVDTSTEDIGVDGIERETNETEYSDIIATNRF